MIPLRWNHGTDPEDVVGQIHPEQMQETEDGLRVTGSVDLDTARGRSVWALMKRNAVGFSFGYIATTSHKSGDTRVITGLDIFEVSAVPAPANNRTRLLSAKAAGDPAADDFAAVRDHYRDEMTASSR